MVNATNTVNSAAPPDPQSLIQRERAQNKFSPEEMHVFLEGSKERSEKFKQIIQQMERDPVLAADPSYYDLTKDQQRQLTAERINRLSRYIELETPSDFNHRLSLVSVFDPQVGTRIGVNLGLFLTCVRGNGTAEQLRFWSLDKETSKIKHIYGCFGMTELAHGSNVAGLETTATFDKATDEFIINTPHVGATKWWIGGAAHSSTHCSVYARLIVDGEDYGVKTFVVPLRDSDHNLMPGVTVGDIGAKMGRDGIDNGWIQFSSVRIPRFFMLQKFCKVSREGDVVLPPLEQLSYSALLGGRVSMVLDSYRWSARFTTIALRYAIGRRQFKSESATDGLETQLINYPLHQRRLFPFLAASYMISAGAVKLEHTITAVMDELDAAVNANDMPRIMKAVNGMKSLFIDSASLKSTATWMCADIIDQCRQACGGHGYSSYNGFGKAYNDWVVQCTWEGDNSVLAMSVGKPIIKNVVDVLTKGKKIPGSVSFLSDAKAIVGSDAPILNSLEDLRDVKKCLRSIEVTITKLAAQAAETVKENDGKFDCVGAQMVVISKLKAHHYLYDEFLNRINSLDNKDLAPYLQTMAQVYFATTVLEKFSGEFLANNVIPTQLLGQLNNKYIPGLMKELRPHIVAFTDAFQQTDMVLNSTIGNYDGNIYENYFRVVKQQNPPKVTKASYSGALEDMLNRDSLPQRQRFENSPEIGKILSK